MSSQTERMKVYRFGAWAFVAVMAYTCIWVTWLAPTWWIIPLAVTTGFAAGRLWIFGREDRRDRLRIEDFTRRMEEAAKWTDRGSTRGGPMTASRDELIKQGFETLRKTLWNVNSAPVTALVDAGWRSPEHIKEYGYRQWKDGLDEGRATVPATVDVIERVTRMEITDSPPWHRGRAVQWGEIPRDRWVILRRGEDFEQEPRLAGQAVRAWARRNDLDVRTYRDPSDERLLYVRIEEQGE